MARTSILLFTRMPKPGTAKTRLIPSLGPEGAAALQESMTRHIAGRAGSYCLATGARLVIVFDGSNKSEMAGWLGPGNFQPQVPGDLGVKLESAIRDELARGAQKVIVIGSDCPRLSSSHLADAVDALDTHDLVFGPATDGGYFLLGLTTLCQGIFRDIPWGGPDVLATSLAAANREGMKTTLIEMLPDVDEAVDLPDAEEALQEACTVSVIIPVRNEEENLKQLLPRLLSKGVHEILVSDGESTDRSVEIATRYGATIVTGAKGRAAQMNAAAARASGEFLLFLHADTDPPDDWLESIPILLNRPGTGAGAFRFAFREPVRFGRIIEALVALRCRIFSLPYGDQGLFLRRSLFNRLGGFPDWPILEDLELVKRLSRLGRIEITEEKALTSSRRWSEKGVLRIFLLHQAILVGYLFGISPGKLAALRRRFG
jgi:rSAM/selenodomain-associated transferase 2/rSAM/selenodomain-associated transferase 1